MINYYSWGSARISHILRNPFYKGAHLVCRTHQKGIRSGTVNFIPREDWEIIEGCHEAIVSPEEWEQVQELIDRRPTIMKGNSCPFYNMFHGIIYCATCGKSMQVRYEKVAELERTVLPANSGNRLIRRITSARPTTGWARTPVPAIRLKPEIYTTLC